MPSYTPNKRADQDSAFLAHEIGALVDQTVKSKSIAGLISTAVTTNRPAMDFPLLVTPVTTGFVAELADLPLSNLDTASVTATAFKIAGATQVSAEMLDDLDPTIAEQIAQTLSDQVIWSLDTAVLGNTTTNGPSGLQSLAATVVDPGAGALVNTDAFVSSVYRAANATVSAKVSHFVVSPATAEALSLMKDSETSARNLLDFMADGSILVAGVPLLISSLVDSGSVGWAVDKTQSRLVLRSGTTVTKTYVPQNDSYFLSAVARYGWVNLAPASVVRIHHSA